ncbi:hypothetical protein JCM30237_00010 [Halolamina litorea]|uniref:RecA-superfamily ATPase, KaiC/GvpD/RAD55 family n=1 Tax=Halolamina litorea TaxID=1515593 RepID=A0ABD6BRF3_9EURY|nr:hypothetical protein [Halolamina litorea]
MPFDAASERLAFGAERAMQTVRSHAAGRNVLAVLTDTTADEWRRSWERTGVNSEQVGIVECFDLARGAGAATQTSVVSEDLAVATVERPVETRQLRTVLEQFLEGWNRGSNSTLVYLDSLGALVADSDYDSVCRLLQQLRSWTDQPGSGIVATATEACPPRTTARFSDFFAATVGEPAVDAEATTAVQRLRVHDPTTFGYFRSYWRDALAVLERTDRSFVQAGQLAPKTDLSSRVLGTTLSAFARLGVLSVRADTNGPNRYDCRRYDPQRAAELGLVVDSLPE